MTSLWLLVGSALASPWLGVSDAFEGRDVRIWVHGPPGASVVLFATPAPPAPAAGMVVCAPVACTPGPTDVIASGTIDITGWRVIDLPVAPDTAGTGIDLRAAVTTAGWSSLTPIASTEVYAASEDPDYDFIATANELAQGTDPLWWDSDGGGVSDSDERMAGTDPLDATDE